MCRSGLFILVVFLISSFLMTVQANEVEIVKVEFVSKGGESWRVNTTLKHNDTGWDHYADAWRVVDEKGNQLGERILFHPHENEQPFTRSLQRLIVSKNISTVFVEAHDKVHGWSKQRIKVDLKSNKGERYTVR